MIMDNLLVTIDEVVHHLCISNDSGHGIIQDQLGFHKVCAIWFTRQLTAQHNHNHLTMFHGLSNHYLNEDDAFF
jgi:hypothetical protein